jgi:hypothetical protein
MDGAYLKTEAVKKRATAEKAVAKSLVDSEDFFLNNRGTILKTNK